LFAARPERLVSKPWLQVFEARVSRRHAFVVTPDSARRLSAPKLVHVSWSRVRLDTYSFRSLMTARVSPWHPLRPWRQTFAVSPPTRLPKRVRLANSSPSVPRRLALTRSSLTAAAAATPVALPRSPKELERVD